jgi:DNA primase small subunit
MNERSLRFVKGAFSSYYASREVWIPREMERREFGFFPGREKVMLRHRSFGDGGALHSFLIQQSPLDVYYSVATYDHPEWEMSEKGWRNADVVFDIDADHLELQCKEEHDLWICTACRNEGRGPKPTQCPSCSKGEIAEITWICDKCLGLAKQEVYKLMEILQEDFGIADEKVSVYFSGHRGYHVHIQDSLASIDQAARKEIVDYMTGTGLDPSLHGLTYGGGLTKDQLSSGWGARIIKSIYEMVKGLPLEDAAQARRRQRMSEELMGGNLEALSRMMDRRKFEALIAEAINRTSVRVDPVVTTDVHRLFRLPETLNSKTGFSKRAVPLRQLDSFDPLTDAVALRGKTRNVHIASAPRFRICDGWYGPYHDEDASLSQEVAILLICKGAAEVAD